MRRPDTLFVGQVIHDLPEVASTNAYALSLLSKSKPAEGTVISTFRQTEGRGQIGSNWESEPEKNISLSILFYPEFLPVLQQFHLNMAISLAVRDFAGHFLTPAVKIKWPNDIFVNDRKIAGILIQNTIHKSHIRSSVMGIGININQKTFGADTANPTSFLLETNREFDLRDLVAPLCQFVEQRYLQLKSGKIVPMQQDYLHHLYRFATEALFQRSSGEVFKGTITGIGDSGLLRVSVQGETEDFDLKTIKFL